MSDQSIQNSSLEFKKRALIVFIKELFYQIDEIATLKKRGSEARLSLNIFREMCSVIRDFNTETLALYYDLLVSLAVTSIAPKSYNFNEQIVEAESKSRIKFIARIRKELTEKAA